ASVDDLMPHLSICYHREVEMAHKVISADMAELVQKMQQALQNERTTLAAHSRKLMCQAAHAVVIDSKTLLDTVDSVRQRMYDQKSKTIISNLNRSELIDTENQD